MTKHRHLLFASALVTAMILPVAALAQGGFDVAGKFDLITPPQPTSTTGKIEVVDVFWYGCPHCFTFLPEMERYEASKPDYVDVVRMPAIFRDTWEIHARAYYTAKVLGVDGRLHRPIFEAIHRKRQPLDTREKLARFFAANGVNKADFEKTYGSFAVESMVRKSKVMQSRYGIRGTPSVIVNGKYRVSGNRAGSYENMVKVIAALADKERKSQIAAR